MSRFELDHFDWLSQLYSEWRETSKLVNLNTTYPQLIIEQLLGSVRIKGVARQFWSWLMSSSCGVVNFICHFRCYVVGDWIICQRNIAWFKEVCKDWTRVRKWKRMIYKQTQTKILMIIMMKLEPSVSTASCIYPDLYFKKKKTYPKNYTNCFIL